MSFLTPLFLLGGLAVVLPVLFHLTRRSTKQRQVFSTLMFFRPTPPRLTQRNRVEHWLLLLLRCVVIGLLAFAFARPFLREPATLVPEALPPQRWVVLLDTSASLRREGLWTAVLSEYRQVVEDLGPQDELAVLTFDRQVRTVLPLAQWRAADAQERRVLALGVVEEIQPGWGGTRLDLALMAAAELLNEADALADSAVTKKIRVITDLQSGAQLSALQGYAWPAGVEIVTHLVRPPLSGNAGVHWVVSAETDPTPAGSSGVRVRVTNAADSRQDQFELRWSDAAGVEPMRVQVAPGQSRLFTLAPSGEGTELGSVRLAGDEHDFDNTVHTLPAKATERTVWFWSADRPEDPKRLGYYLERAFPETAQRKTQLLTLDPDAAWAGLTAGKGLVITTGGIPTGSVAAARAWVEDGGTLLWVLDAVGGAEGLRELLGVDAMPTSEADVQGYALLGQIDFRHPLFAPFADPRYSDFTKIHFWRHRRVGFDAVSDARVLARFDGGDPALVEVVRGQGRVLVLTAGWHPADGQLALSTKFVPLLHALVEYAVGEPIQRSQYYVGDSVSLPGAEAIPAQVTLPDQRTVEVVAGPFRETGLPGIYHVSQGTAEWQFAVNVDPAETRTSPMADDDLERLGVPMRGVTATVGAAPGREPQQRAAELESQQKLWRWLILGALLVLGLESWVAGRLTRRRVEAEVG